MRKNPKIKKKTPGKEVPEKRQKVKEKNIKKQKKEEVKKSWTVNEPILFKTFEHLK